MNLFCNKSDLNINILYFYKNKIVIFIVQNFYCKILCIAKVAEEKSNKVDHVHTYCKKFHVKYLFSLER